MHDVYLNHHNCEGKIQAFDTLPAHIIMLIAYFEARNRNSSGGEKNKKVFFPVSCLHTSDEKTGFGNDIPPTTHIKMKSTNLYTEQLANG